MILTYKLKSLGHLLKTGQAWIEGKVSGGDRWPDEPHYWIIVNSITQTTHHVLVDDRPTWAKYVVPHEKAI